MKIVCKQSKREREQSITGLSSIFFLHSNLLFLFISCVSFDLKNFWNKHIRRVWKCVDGVGAYISYKPFDSFAASEHFSPLQMCIFNIYSRGISSESQQQ